MQYPETKEGLILFIKECEKEIKKYQRAIEEASKRLMMKQ